MFTLDTPDGTLKVSSPTLVYVQVMVPSLALTTPSVPHSGAAADADPVVTEVSPAVVTAVSPPMRTALAAAPRNARLIPPTMSPAPNT